MKKIKKKEVTLDDLAGMVSEGFSGVEERFNSVEDQLKDLDEGHSQIKLRLDNVAYRFELVELQKRVEHLEHKAGIRYK